MQLQQLYTNCLAQGAYYISHNGEAAIIDPLRETQPYLNLLKKNNDTLKYIFETHFHADFVSGHIDLSKATGAQIVFGPTAKTAYKSYNASDNEEFKIGDLTLKAMHTPGHTLESTTYLLLNEKHEPHCIFTGDTLFIGDVGRPDLAIDSNLSQFDLAGMLYDSLHSKILPLPDSTIVYPAHGAGSACGKNMSKETFDTLGNQKKVNYALQNISKNEFIAEVTTGILPPPQYFVKNANLNMKGYKNFNDVMLQGTKMLSVYEFEMIKDERHPLILDVRTPKEFADGHIPNSLFIGIDGQFAPWVGTLIKDINKPILIVAPTGREEETIMRLSRVGYDNCVGYLQGGFESWKMEHKPIATIKSIDAENFSKIYNDTVCTLDVRKPNEFASGHLNFAKNNPLDFINDWKSNLDKTKPYYLHCAGGLRSMIAASILKANGFQQLINIEGGYSAIIKTIV